MPLLTEDGQRIAQDMAARHDFGVGAVRGLLIALVAGGGRQVQFNHPEFGGMGQWSQGGMIMIGDMFNNGLKARVDALCNDLAGAIQNAAPLRNIRATPGQGSNGERKGASLFTSDAAPDRWPAELGRAASTGSQNDLHYAVFPETHRLALDHNGQVTVYDTGDHHITGFAQQQGGGQSITFTSQHGLVRLTELRRVHGHGTASASSPYATPTQSPSPHRTDASEQPGGPVHAMSADEIFSRIERLADLRKKDIITAAEFDAKKAELLARL